jgi:methionyl-tRNA formyltransferase
MKSVKKYRIVVFGSFYRGYYVLSELLTGKIAEAIEIVGVATDDPQQNFVNPKNRLWQYPHKIDEETMVPRLAQRHGLALFTERVKTNAFYDKFENDWKPDLCIMATFGQKINERLFSFPKHGFFNLHPCMDDAWPSKYVGGNPFHALKLDHRTYTQIAMHHVDGDFDTGELVGYSEKIAFPAEASVIDMHKITSPIAGKFCVDEIAKILKI